MKTQLFVLDCSIDLYFHNYKHAIEVDENGHINKNNGYEMKRQKAIEQELGCEFIRIVLNKEDFDIFNAINEIFRYIKQSFNESTKTTLINRISMRLLRLEFKLDNTIKSKAIKYSVKKIIPHYD